MPKLFIATPAYGEMYYSVYVRSLVRLQQALGERGWPSLYVTISCADLPESRNALLTRWFDKSDASHLLFIDADMGFEPELVLDMVALDEPLVGAVYPRRKVHLDRLTELAAQGEPAARAVAKAHDFVVTGATRGARSGFIRVESCGAGVLLIRRDCIEEMLRKLPELSDETAPHSSPLARGFERMICAFDPLRLEHARLSEDFAFCWRWRRQCGGEVWASAAHEVAHIGLHKFSSRYEDLWADVEAPEGAVAAEVTPLPGKPSSPRPLKVSTGRLGLSGRKAKA